MQVRTHADRLAEVIDFNKALLAKARDLNRRVRCQRFAVLRQDQLTEWLLERLAGARGVDEIQDFDSLRLPELDAKEVERILVDFPDTICVLGVDLSVDYSTGRHPQVVLSAELIQSHRWRELPDDGIKLPCGNAVSVMVNFGRYGRASGVDMSELKIHCNCLANGLAWENWQDRPVIVLPDERDPSADLSDMMEVVYGSSILDGSDLIGFGTVVFNHHRANASDSWFVSTWFQQRHDAESARDEAAIKWRDLQERARAKQLFQQAKEQAEAIRAEMFQMQQSEDLRVARADLCDQIKHRAKKGYPYSTPTLLIWINESLRLLDQARQAQTNHEIPKARGSSQKRRSAVL